MRNQQREVQLRCQCGSDQFEYEEKRLERGIRCARCDRKYSKDELEMANQTFLKRESEKLAQAAFKDIKKNLQRKFPNLR